MSGETSENESERKTIVVDGAKSISDQFVSAEIVYLREEIKYRTLEQSAIERSSIVAVGAVYAALATLQISDIDKDLVRWTGLFWLLPFLLIMYGRARLFDHGQAIRRIGKYIGLREKLLHTTGGWQIYRHEPLTEKPSERKEYFINWKLIKIYWILVPAITALLAIWKSAELFVSIYAWLVQSTAPAGSTTP